ncbi:hypothetical protein L2748_14255 [Shewanella sairae]|uniref:hypothetical protein n=1 Tax=Shewanella sairae TaxID=190310 RepID=UPI00200BC901|nr:hypothetical protein [Shewanella sairae]MCL1130860.1 hypothetical protein [Shewanella sairae]
MNVKLKEEIENIHLEFFQFQNNVLGFFIIALALGCLGSNQPGVNALICLITPFIIYFSSHPYYYKYYGPRKINGLFPRIRIKRIKNPNIFLEFKKTPVYAFGVAFLLFVACLDLYLFLIKEISFCGWSKAIECYIYGG